MRTRFLIAAAVLAVLAPLAALAPASAAPGRTAVHVAQQSCNTSMTGTALPNQGAGSQIVVNTNSCNRLLRAVGYCWNGHNNYYVYGPSITGGFEIVYCGGSDSLQGSGCQEHYSTGWSAIFLRWIAGDKDPNPYPCP